MKFNYFAFISFYWAVIGIFTRLIIIRLGKRWNDWEENVAYTDEKPRWLIFVHVFAIALIIFTWYRVFTSDVTALWIIASLMTLILIKTLLQLFKYTEFKACVINASGRVSDKERKKYFVTMELYKLKDYVMED